MYLVLGTVLTLISIIYCYSKMKVIKIKDFENEEDSMDNDNVKCEELRILDKFSLKSDNVLMLMLSTLISGIYLYLSVSQTTLLTIFFTPTIPILVTLFIVDIRLKRLPDYFTYKIAMLGAVALITAMILYSSHQIILGNILNALILFVVYFVLAVLTGGALGGGDIKLIGAVGLFFSMAYTVQFLMLPFVIGAMQGLYLMVIKKKKSNDLFAFAPAIIISILIVAFLQFFI